MHAQPPRTLKRLLKQYGQELIDDPRRTEALLRDLCGQHTREIFVLVNAQKQRVPNELLAAPAWMPRQATYSRLSRLLQTKLAITEDAADWAVASWAAALEIDQTTKNNAWSWLPGQTRPPAKSTSRKSRSKSGKKRQNSRSSVQSSKKSARLARQRAERAELGWGFLSLSITRLAHLIQLPAFWVNVLPWAALVTATLFLLGVVYWTSSTRPISVVSPETIGNERTANETPVAGSENNSENAGTVPEAASIGSNVTPLPELPEPPRHYLSEVMPLPAWANVNVSEGPLLVRQGPSTDQPWFTTLQDGEPVHIEAFSEDGKWSRIRSPHAGWVSTDFILFISADATQSRIRLSVQQRRTQPYEVSVRAEPDANASVTATLPPNELVVVAAVLGEPATWYQIADPLVGWIAANDLASP